MHRTTLLILCVVLMGISSALIAASQDKIPFTSTGIASLKGQNICNLEGEFPSQFGVYLDHAKEHVVQYRERNGIVAVFLLSSPTLRCGIVDAALELTPLVRKGEVPEFKCYTDREGGTTWGKWGHVIGLADNHGGRKRFVTARLAWRVNVTEKRFEEMKGDTVHCDTSGYTD